ncbi:Rne/Rng family ribonuclease [Guyparkeria halophila]|uniref:Ribonuclease E n=1 Tax=Guyparkeria halophila TaxID=47960 RepID=A0ABZ0YUB2_9GAMM|nr:Rne/Rng family ribonuclease [Guyparkeria halophila]WQH15765.1 Rne/Rng family ribonuclease [Guyparkeria halophila]
MKRMLINATHSEEIRVALVDGQRLYDIDIETPSREQKKANIYKATITRIEPSLEAVFVNYGANRHGFLPFKEISPEYFDPKAVDDKGRPIIKDALKEGQELIVQVEKEERGNKGAALTTLVSLAGRYLVVMPNNPKAGGVSRRIEGDDRAEIKAALAQLNVPAGMGLIVRTAGVGRDVEELQWDLDYLVQVWSAIHEAAESRQAPFLIYQESNLIIRALRDYMRNDIGEILIDEPTIYQQAMDFVQMVTPKVAEKIKLYDDPTPLFSRYQIEAQIESAYQRNVTLPSGGELVFDVAEAMTAVDINSGRNTKGQDIEDTAFNTNLEAAEEIARQLRLRDLGGLIVIDFIDMGSSKHQREVENRLRDSLKYDRARVQTSRISRFGLLEMSRQRLRASLEESSQHMCPRCNGQGVIRSVESLSLAILRLLVDEAMKDNTGRVIAQVPIDVATYLLNEKRDQINEIEQSNNVDLLLIPNINLETPHYEIERVRADDNEARARDVQQMIEPLTVETPSPEPRHRQAEKAAVQTIPRAAQPAAEKPAKAAEPAPAAAATPAAESAPPRPIANGAVSLLRRVVGQLFGSRADEDEGAEAGSRKDKDKGKGAGKGSEKAGDRSGRKGGGRRQSGDQGGEKPKSAARDDSQDKDKGQGKGKSGNRRRRGRGRRGNGGNAAPQDTGQKNEQKNEQQPAEAKAEPTRGKPPTDGQRKKDGGQSGRGGPGGPGGPGGSGGSGNKGRGDRGPKSEPRTPPPLGERERQMVEQQLAAPISEGKSLPLDVAKKKGVAEELPPNAAVRLEASDRLVKASDAATAKAAASKSEPSNAGSAVAAENVTDAGTASQPEAKAPEMANETVSETPPAQADTPVEAPKAAESTPSREESVEAEAKPTAAAEPASSADVAEAKAEPKPAEPSQGAEATQAESAPDQGEESSVAEAKTPKAQEAQEAGMAEQPTDGASSSDEEKRER